TATPPRRSPIASASPARPCTTGSTASKSVSAAISLKGSRTVLAPVGRPPLWASSTPSSLRSSTKTHDLTATTRPCGLPRSYGTTCGTPTAWTSRGSPSAGPSTGSATAGSGPATCWPAAPIPGGRQKGAQNRAFPTPPHGPVDARRDRHHGNPTDLRLLRPHRRAGPHPDQRQPCPPHPSRGDQRPKRRCPALGDADLDASGTSALPEHDPGALAGPANRAVLGPTATADGPPEPAGSPT